MTEEERVDAAKTKRILEGLVETEGFQWLEAVAKAQGDSRKGRVIYAPTEDSLKLEYEKGEIHGMELLISSPRTALEAAKAVLQQYVEEEATE